MGTRKVEITSGTVTMSAELDSSRTADAIWNALPLRSVARTWGDEVYFSIPVSIGAEDARELVQVGDLGYWPPGKAFCIFFGPTPASVADEVRPASPVNVFGRVSGDATVLRHVADGAEIVVKRSVP